jgi:thiamine biosynthesis lipoprotein
MLTIGIVSITGFLRKNNIIFGSILLSLIFILTFNGCSDFSSDHDSVHATREKFHTIFTIRIFQPYPEDVDSIIRACWDLADSIESATNFYDIHSELSKINQMLFRNGKAELKGELLSELLEKTFGIAREIDYGLDPTIGSVSILWPFGEENPMPPAIDQIQKALKWVHGKDIRVQNHVLTGEKGQLLDLSSVNKGFAVKQIIEYLKSRGIRNAIVDAGGNLGILWNRGDSIMVSIRHPESPGKIIAYFLYNGNEGIATSGNYMNYFVYGDQKYHHILDPLTGFPSDSASSVTVIASDPFLADGLATGLFIKGRHYAMQWLKKHPGTQVIFIQSRQKKITLPSAFPYPFFVNDSTYTIQYE